MIDLRNSGCDGGGGFIATELVTVAWQQEASVSGAPFDGRADGLPPGVYGAGTGLKIRSTPAERLFIAA